MIKFEKDIIIHATREKVWEAIVDEKHYQEWTTHFFEGSYYRGSWNEGSDIRFLTRDPEGKESGMFSTIVLSEYPTHILIKHLGMVTDNHVDTTSEIAREWTPSYEEYFIEKVEPNLSRFRVVAELPERYQQEILDSWDLALSALKSIAERNERIPQFPKLT